LVAEIQRARLLETRGYSVLRFSNAEVMNQTQWVLEAIQPKLVDCNS